MTATSLHVVERRHAVQYDGTNSGDIDNLFSLNTLSEAGGVWTFESPPGSSTFTVNTNEWIIYAQNMALATHSSTAFETFYTCNAACEDIEGVSTGVMVRAAGVAAVPTLTVLNPNATVAVQLQPAMPDSTYSAYAHKFAGVALGDLVINSVAVVDADTVNVSVSNTGIINIAGANILVHVTD